MPFDASHVLEIDPAAFALRRVGEALAPGGFKYTSVAAASNGRLYAAPASASRVLEIDIHAGKTWWDVLVRQVTESARAHKCFRSYSVGGPENLSILAVNVLAVNRPLTVHLVPKQRLLNSL